MRHKIVRGQPNERVKFRSSEFITAPGKGVNRPVLAGRHEAWRNRQGLSVGSFGVLQSTQLGQDHADHVVGARLLGLEVGCASQFVERLFELAAAGQLGAATIVVFKRFRLRAGDRHAKRTGQQNNDQSGLQPPACAGRHLGMRHIRESIRGLAPAPENFVATETPSHREPGHEFHGAAEPQPKL